MITRIGANVPTPHASLISKASQYRTKQAVFLFLRSISSFFEAVSSPVFEAARDHPDPIQAKQRRELAPASQAD